MINVLHFTNIGLANGIATMVLNYYRIMDRTKYKFTFLAMDNIELKDTYINEIRELGGDVIIIPHYSKGIFNYIKETKRILKTNKFDIVHCHQGLIAIPFMLQVKKLGLKLIVHSHSPGLNSKKKEFLVKIFRPYINKKSDYKIACSKVSANFLFGKNNNATIIPNPFNISKYKYNQNARKLIRNQLGIKDNDFLYICVARFSREKNQEFLLNVFKRIENDNFKLLFVGNSEGETKIRDMIDALELKNKVIVLTNRNDVPELLSASDCYLAPSLFEGLGLSILEAECNGLPCVLSTAIVDEVKINENLITNRLDVTEWLAILQNKNLLQRIFDLEKIENSCFNINNNSQTLEKIYKKVYSLS